MKKIPYEKPGIPQSSDWFFIGLLFVGLLAEILYFYGVAPPDFWKIRVVDVASVIAQTATASAFFLGFHQYRRSRDTERQNVLIAECKSAVAKMSAEIYRLDTGDATNERNILSVMTRLGNLASDFDILYHALSEGVNKAIVRMHWQSMYFNELRPSLSELDLNAIATRANGYNSGYGLALLAAEKKVESDMVVDAFKRYRIYKQVMIDVELKGCGISRALSTSDFNYFAHFFFDKEATNDYLYGVMNKVNIQVSAPLIAAWIEVSESALLKAKSSQQIYG